jgi:DNA-binding transcriptional MerR regulator
VSRAILPPQMAQMTDERAGVQIPDRALFKPSEVCDLVKVQPYVLRSWEAEFPDLGVAKSEGGTRVYRRVDVEQALKIKHLLLVEGLTLAGARRKLQEEATPIGADAPLIDELIGRHARERLTAVKRGLQGILELLAGRATSDEFRLSAPAARLVAAPEKRASTPVRGKPAASAPRGRNRPKNVAGARRKR